MDEETNKQDAYHIKHYKPQDEYETTCYFLDEDTEKNRGKKSRKNIETMNPRNTITPMILYK